MPNSRDRGVLPRSGLPLTLAVSAAIFSGFLLFQTAYGSELRFLSIGTGATNSTDFAIGGVIASAVSSPPGSRACDRGGSCGVPGLVAVAQSTQGSIENVAAVAEGAIDTALVQADVLYWAYHGTGMFRDQGSENGLRAIANLFPATLQIVVRRDAGIANVKQLKDKRVSLGENGSGTLVTARTILAAYGMTEDDVEPLYLKPAPASDLLVDGEIDGFFVVGGVPASVIGDVARRIPISLIPINGTTGEELKSFYPFFSQADVPAGSYPDVGYVESVGINTQWIISDRADPDFVYNLTKSLWHERSQSLFDNGHPEGRRIRLDTALQRIAIPLHSGAARFYAEEGVEK